MLDITFDDELWLDSNVANGSSVDCDDTDGDGTSTAVDDGLANSGFTLVETSKDSGVFTGDFQVPAEYCARSSGSGVILSLIHI